VRDSRASSTPLAAWTIFVDFDGTITDLDTFDVLVRHFAGNEAWLRTEVGLDAGTMSLRDVLSLQASYVRGSFEDVAALLRAEVTVDPTFAPFVADARAHDIPVTVLSSGIAPIIRDRLVRVGLGDLAIVANDIDPAPTGWTIAFRDPVGNGTDKAGIVRAARDAGTRTLFIGDGRSDYAAAVVADRCFAKRGLPLERYLREHDVPFESFETFDEIALDSIIANTFARTE